jgi:Family of unknown function (DUF5670)
MSDHTNGNAISNLASPAVRAILPASSRADGKKVEIFISQKNSQKHTHRPDAARSTVNPNRRKVMLWTIFVILLVLWLLGLVSSYTLGGFIHILLVLAIVVLIINLVSGRRGI